METTTLAHPRESAPVVRTGRSLRRTLRFALAVAVACVAPLGAALEVTTASDDNSAGSLRQRLANAVDGETITFNAALNGQTVFLTQGELVPTKNVTIDASALPAGVTVYAFSAWRVFSIPANKTVVLNGLTLLGGKSADGGAGQSGADGGGILNLGTLTLNDCYIISCATGKGGSGFGVAGGAGGAIANGALVGSFYQYGTLTLNRCTLVANRTGDGGSFGGGGGAINNPGGTVTLNQCTLVGNYTGTGSGGYGQGGAIVHSGSLVLNQCTITGNRTGAGGDGGGVLVTNSSTLVMTNTVIAGNTTDAASPTSYPDLSDATTGNITANGRNFLGSTAGLNSVPPGTLTGDPKLGPFGFYGGRTPTCLPLVGSPLLNPAGGLTSSPFATDQRGVARLFGATVDIGAVESQPLQAATLLLLEDFETGTSQRFRSTWFATQSNFGPGPVGTGTKLQLTSAAGGLNNSVAWDAVPAPNPEVTLCVDFRMSPDPDGSYAADGWGIGFFKTTAYGTTGAINPATNDVNSLVWEDMSVLPCFPNAIAVGLDVFNWGAPDRITFCSPAADGTGVLRFGGDLGFDLNDGVTHRLRLTLRESGADTLATLVIVRDATGVQAEQVIFADLVLPGVKISEFPSRLIAGGRTGGFAVETLLDNVVLSTVPTVTTLADENNAAGTPGAFSLREALRDAQPAWDPVVRFAPALSGGSIVLANGQLSLAKNLSVDASALPGGITLNANSASRVLEVLAGATARFEAVTFTGGVSGNSGPPGRPGGGIYNGGSLSLVRSTVRGNRASSGAGTGAGGSGGGIYNADTLLLDRSTVSGNIAGNGGAAGGLGGFGGGVFNAGTLVLRDTTITTNAAGNSGAVAGRGGGVANNPNTYFALVNSIIAENSDFGGAPDIYADTPATVTTSANGTNFVGNTAQADLVGAAGILTGSPKLAPLANYGGPAWTRPPLPGSPVIDAGVSSIYAIDQRGATRVTGLAVDVGAVEAFPFGTLALVDTDVDGIDDRLEPAYPGLTVGVNDAARDSDGDGQTDAKEIKAMTDPTNPNSRLQILYFAPWGGGGYLIAWSSFPGLRYVVERDTGLTFSGPDYVAIGPYNADAVNLNTSVIWDGVGNKSFFRVRVSP